MAKQKRKRGGGARTKNAGGGGKNEPPNGSDRSNGNSNNGGNGSGKGKRRSPKGGHRPVSDDDDDDAAFRNALLDQGNVVREMNADGNCLFRSISDQLYDDRGAKHDVVRHDVCNHLDSHREEFQHFLLMEDDDEDVVDIEEYVANMRGDGEWGGNVEVVVASRVYGRNVMVFSSEYANGVLSIACDEGGERDGEDILLSYHGNDHYNSVKPINKQSTRPNEGRSSATHNTKNKGDADGKAPGATRKGGAAPMKLEMTRGPRPPARGSACPCGSGLKYKKCCMAEEKRRKRLLAKQRSGGGGDVGVVAEDANGDGGGGDERGVEFIGDFKVLTI